jgi:hypothetical protein
MFTFPGSSHNHFSYQKQTQDSACYQKEQERQEKGMGSP